MIEVTRDQFFAYVGPRDVSPRCADPHYSLWELRDRTVVGKSTPGWKYPAEPCAYYLIESAARQVTQNTSKESQ